MSRRVSRSSNVLRISRFLTVFVAAVAVVVSTIAPATLATASASTGTTSLARVASDPVQTNIVKTSLAGFNPGNIISDAVFTNDSTMTEAQIQSFLNSKVPKCVVGKDEDGLPFVCLKDLRVATQSKSADAYCSAYSGASGESAARILYKVATACNINPQVLIVMLQKEQGLVTHVWPSNWRYNKAMGQACPDTAPCNVAFAGFFAQVYGAARQMQIYMEGKYFQWYKAGKTWDILYHPDADLRCGTSPVYIANKATEALYYYTPYQPNAAALRAGYGLGDRCSSYGNRNFYNYFTDWFGSSQGAPAVERPVLRSMNTSNYVVAVDASGTVWGYPYTQKVWGTKVQLAPARAGVTSLVNLGDFDGDGDRDFVVVGNNFQASLVRSDGAKSLGAAESLPGDWTGVTGVIASGDFDGDGVVDVFTTNAKGLLYLRSGTGFGSFRAPVRAGSGWHNMSQISGGVDMDGDGNPDVVARNAAGDLYLYPGDGRGGWRARVQMGHGWSVMTSVFSVEDFDGDGRSDVLAHGTDGKLVLYRGLGSGRVTSAGIVGSGWAAIVGKTAPGGSIGDPRPYPGGIGDVDGVPGNDVVALSTAGEAYIYGGNGVGKWGDRSTIATGWQAADKVFALGDYNRDGYADLGRIDEAGLFLLYPGKRGGGFSDPVQIGHGWESFTRIIGGFDYDGDRFTDVVVTTDDGRMLLYRGNGGGRWLAGGGAEISHGWTIADEIFYAGDFNRDGRGEFIARLTDGTLRSYPLTGKGKFAPASQIGHGWDIFDTMFSPGDFNSDGNSDIIAVDVEGAMFLYAGVGNGKMKSRVKIGSGWTVMSRIG